MKGVWIDEFEGSQFFPNVMRPPAHDVRPRIWLDTERVRIKHGYENKGRNGRAVLVEFIGRRTKYRGWSGHFGMFDYEIIVDRVISMRELP